MRVVLGFRLCIAIILFGITFKNSARLFGQKFGFEKRDDPRTSCPDTLLKLLVCIVDRLHQNLVIALAFGVCLKTSSECSDHSVKFLTTIVRRLVPKGLKGLLCLQILMFDLPSETGKPGRQGGCIFKIEDLPMFDRQKQLITEKACEGLGS